MQPRWRAPQVLWQTCVSSMWATRLNLLNRSVLQGYFALILMEHWNYRIWRSHLHKRNKFSLVCCKPTYSCIPHAILLFFSCLLTKLVSSTTVGRLLLEFCCFFMGGPRQSGGAIWKRDKHGQYLYATTHKLISFLIQETPLENFRAREDYMYSWMNLEWLDNQLKQTI